VFHRSRHFEGTHIPGTEVKDVTWLRPDGAEMAEADWKNAEARTLGLLLSGEAGLMHLTEAGEQETDDTFCLLFNAAHEDVAFTLPTPDGGRWQAQIDTADELGFVEGPSFARGDRITLKARSLQLLRLVR